MIHDWKMELYWRLPVFLQEAALSLYAGRLEKLYYGDGYDSWVQQAKKWQTWSLADVKTWQSQELQSVIELAATRVPFYRRTWQKLDWKSVRSNADLRLLPVLDKQSIRQKEGEFLVEGLDPKMLWMEKTSGTTGTSLRIYWPMSMLPKWWAVSEVMVRNVAGARQDLPRAMVGGRPIVPGDTSNPPYWRFNRRWRQLYLSSYHISPTTASSYAAAILRYGSRWITGYGSAIAALAESALEAGLPSLPLRSAIVSGDTLLPNMRSSIERFFQCKCFDNYGQCEAVALAMECPLGRMHVIPAVGILEILREDGSSCQPGEVGEMVATGLLNDAMPLIRYRLGDYAAWSKEQTCPCGNPNHIITNLEGRVDDYLMTSDERKIGRLSTAVKRSPSIHSAQIMQDRPGHAYLLVRPGNNYRHSDAIAVRDDILSRIGAFDIEIAEVSEIPKTAQGKFSLVVRLIDRPHMRKPYETLLKIAKGVASTKSTDEQRSSSLSSCLLDQIDVVILTSGHEVTDSRVYTRVACGVGRLGANVTVVGKPGHRTQNEVNVLTVPEPSSRLMRFLWQPWRCLWAIRHLNADIIHFHDAEILVTLPVAKLWRRQTKFVYDVHEDFANLMLIRDWLPTWMKPLVRILTNTAEKALALLADAIVGVTSPLADKFPNRERIVAYNYISRNFFEQAATVNLPPQNREFDLVHLGTLNLRRAGFLVAMLEEFHRLRPGARSLVIGAPPEVEKVLREQIPENCILLGKIPYEKVPALLANAKVGLDVHPWLGPHLEVALPVKVCEYMAAGCAVVSSSMPVLDQILAEMNADSETIKIIKGGTPIDYAKAAIELLETIDKGLDPGSKLRDLALKHMVWEQEAVKIAQLYLRLLDRNTCAISS